jgi:hypothetical protein
MFHTKAIHEEVFKFATVDSLIVLLQLLGTINPFRFYVGLGPTL